MKHQGKILPPCPVIHTSTGIPYVNGNDKASTTYNALLDSFLETHKQVKYVLLDGSHKTTAAALSHTLIPALIIERDSDFKKAQKMKKAGELFGWYAVGHSIKEALKTLAQHHFGTKQFLTVEEKTALMIKNRDVPGYMISFFKDYE